MQFSPHSSLIPVLFAALVSSRNCDGFHHGASNNDGEGKQAFSSFMRQYLENGRRYG